MPLKISKYVASEAYWKSFHKLSSEQKESVRAAWKKFKMDPFAPSLGAHMIRKLTSRRKNAVYSVVIEGNLRCIFEIRGDVLFTIDVGTHDLYR